MPTFELVLMLIAAVLASSLISQLIPRISAPLIQIAIGIVIAVFVNGGINIDIDPELFLVLFIAPLLFNEANHIDRLGFWKNRGMIISLALGLVIATTLAVGFAVNTLDAAIPLAAAFALGASLGPTDAVAVSSMSESVSLSQKQKAILAGESLINDASGLVAFQFAVAAALTGEFSLAGASSEFLITFLGGIALGAVIGVVLNLFISFVRALGLENRTFHVLFEVAVPFAAFIAGESLGVSGVLTVVACGVVFSISHNQTGPQTSKMNIVSASVWDVLVFALNGIVFVLLGMMLPGGMIHEIENEVSTLDLDLLGIAAIVTVVVIGARFLWTLVVERVFGSAEEIDSGLVRHAAVLAFAGAKGAITLSIIMSMSSAVASKPSLVFIASVVILFTLLLANFIVPALVPSGVGDIEREMKATKCYIKILRQVIERLQEEQEEAENGAQARAYQSVIDEYSTLIWELKGEGTFRGGTHEKMIDLRLEALAWQREHAKALYREKEYDMDAYRAVISALDDRQSFLERGSRISWTLSRVARRLRVAARSLIRATGAHRLASAKSDAEKLRRDCMEFALRRLEDGVAGSGDGRWTAEEYSRLAAEYRQNLLSMQTAPMSVTAFIKAEGLAEEIRMRSLQYEQALLGEAYEAKEIDRRSTNELRRQISAMQLDAAGDI